MVYNIARLICRIILAVFRRWEVYGRDKLPQSGGIIIVSNHASFWDPVIIGCTFQRKVSYMGKEELFKINPIFTWLIKQLQTFPIKRGQMDLSAVKFALNHLKSGNMIGLFPEGTRTKSGDIQEARNGAAMLAVKAGVPILPVGIIGSKGWGKVVVKVGDPIDMSAYSDVKVSKEVLHEVSQVFMREIRNLLNEH